MGPMEGSRVLSRIGAILGKPRTGEDVLSPGSGPDPSQSLSEACTRHDPVGPWQEVRLIGALL